MSVRKKTSSLKQLRQSAGERARSAGLEGLESRVLLSSSTLTNPFTTSITFTGRANGGSTHPSSLVEDASGNVFGVTLTGGQNNYGTVFEIPAGTSSVVTLAAFSGGNGGFSPEGNLVLENGVIYGTTVNGGQLNRGTIYSFDIASSTITTLASFPGGNGNGVAYPTSGLVSDGNGTFYGTAFGSQQQKGGIFSFDTATGTLSTVVALPLKTRMDTTPAIDPATGLVKIVDNTIFATTTGAGVNGRGSIVSYVLGSGATKATTVASFDGTHGAGPIGSLLYVTNADGSGALVGATSGGGAKGVGTIFDAPVTDTSGTLLTSGVTIGLLGSFTSTVGARPNGTLLLVNSTTDAPTNSLSGATLYGVAASGGGGDGAGSVFELVNPAPTTAGNVSTIRALTKGAFGNTTGSHPSGGLVLDTNAANGASVSNPRLIGTTANGGRYKDGSVFVLPANVVPAVNNTLRLVFTKQPTGGTGTLGTISVAIEDLAGHVQRSDETTTVTLSVATGPTMGLTGTLTATVVNGVATFTGISVPMTGGYTLLAQADTSGVATGQSTSFSVKTIAPAVVLEKTVLESE